MVRDKNLEYITRTFARTKRKDYENYAQLAIWRGIDRSGIKPVTQQYVKRYDNHWALIDLFFPQLNIGIEIDEAYHAGQYKQVDDQIRADEVLSRFDYIGESMKPKIIRVNAHEGLERFESDIRLAIKEINEAIVKLKNGVYVPWNYSDEFDTSRYLSKGYIDLSEDDAKFRHQIDVANLFGHQYRGMQRGACRHGVDSDIMIWFPKLYETGYKWHNKINSNGTEIVEWTDGGGGDIPVNQRVRYTFGDKKDDVFNTKFYRFLGEFQLDSQGSCSVRHIWKRTKTRVPVVQPSGAVTICEMCNRGDI